MPSRRGHPGLDRSRRVARTGRQRRGPFRSRSPRCRSRRRFWRRSSQFRESVASPDSGPGLDRPELLRRARAVRHVDAPARFGRVRRVIRSFAVVELEELDGEARCAGSSTRGPPRTRNRTERRTPGPANRDRLPWRDAHSPAHRSNRAAVSREALHAVIRSNRERGVSAWAKRPRAQGATGFDRPFDLDLDSAEAPVNFDRPAPRRRSETSVTGAGRIGRRTESRARPDLRAQRAPTASR